MDKKILMIGSYFPTLGGAEKVLDELCLNLKKDKKTKVIILCPDIRGDSPEKSLPAKRAWTLIKNKKKVEKFRFLEYFQNYSFVIPAILKGKKIIKNERVDLIHVHYGLSYGIIGAILKKITKKPLVITLHGSGMYFGGIKGIFKPIIKKILNSADVTIAVSEAVQKEAKRFTEKEIQIIRNGIFIKNFENKEEENYILAVGRLAKMKGFEILIKSASDKRLKNIKFVIIGEGPERQALGNLIKKLKLKNVKLVGALSHKKTKEFMSKCSLFVVPSLYGEGLPLVLIEAMACGKPMIGSNIRGIPEAIEDKKNGFLINPNNPLELSDKIYNLIKNKKERNKMGKESRKKVIGEFNLEKNIKQIEKIYEEVLK